MSRWNAILITIVVVVLLLWYSQTEEGNTSNVTCTSSPVARDRQDSSVESPHLQHEVERLRRREKELTEQLRDALASGKECPSGTASSTNAATADKLFVPHAARNTFRRIATKLGDDKAWRHRYDIAYSNYLEPVRHLPLRILEIGLGCDQPTIGMSVWLWEEYLPNSRLTMIEYDAKCTRKWEKENVGRGPKGGVKFYTGDQSDRNFLRRVMQEEKTKYDVIIDDGGHFMHHQIVSFEELWGYVRHGGIYVVEDLNTSYKTHYGGSRRPYDTTNITMVKFLQEKMDRLHAVPVRHHPGKYLEDTEFRSPYHRLDCYHFICVVTRA